MLRAVMTTPRDPGELELLMRSGIPLARAMGLRVVDFDGDRLALAAPLAPNVNDKGCAFGGSIASLLTLAQWGLVNLKLAEAGFDAEVYVADTSLRFLAPVWGELHAEAFVDGDPWPEFFETFASAGKARVEVHAEVIGEEGGAPAARQSARFVAIAPRPVNAV
jgi:thioesterase domain-containing protein